MERFVIIINGFQPLTIITKRSILDVVAVLDPPLKMSPESWIFKLQISFKVKITSWFFKLCCNQPQSDFDKEFNFDFKGILPLWRDVTNEIS